MFDFDVMLGFIMLILIRRMGMWGDEYMVGDLVWCSGMMVCVLYYYEKLGLLSFIGCSEVGYCFYVDVDV